MTLGRMGPVVRMSAIMCIAGKRVVVRSQGNKLLPSFIASLIRLVSMTVKRHGVVP